jgi:hypothetical protein
VSTAVDQGTADGAIAAVEQSLRAERFSVTSDGQEDDLAIESEECRKFRDVIPGGDDRIVPGETASAQSDLFERGNPARIADGKGMVESVSASAEFVEDADDLEPLVELMNDKRAVQCFEEALRKGLESERSDDQAAVEIHSVETQQLGSEGLGDTGGGFQLTADITASGVNAPVSFLYQFVRVDRAVVDVFVVTSSVGYDGPTADRPALLRVLVDAVSDQSN